MPANQLAAHARLDPALRVADAARGEDRLARPEPELLVAEGMMCSPRAPCAP